MVGSISVATVQRPEDIAGVTARILATCGTRRAVRISPGRRDLHKLRLALQQRFWRRHRHVILRTRYDGAGKLVCWAEPRETLR